MTFSRTSLFMLYVEECLEVALSREVPYYFQEEDAIGTGRKSDRPPFSFLLLSFVSGRRSMKHVNSLLHIIRIRSIYLLTATLLLSRAGYYLYFFEAS